MIKVAVKFCGGCDPEYERVEYLDRIKGAAGDRIHWVGLQEEEYAAILLICGCPRACPEEELTPSVSVVSLKSNVLDPEKVVGMLTIRGQSYENRYQR